MHRPELSYLSFASTASLVAAAADLDVAYALVREELFKQLLTAVSLLEWSGERWQPRGASSDAPPITIAEDADDCAIGSTFAVRRSAGEDVTIVPLQNLDGATLMLAIRGDWSHEREPLLTGATLLSLALQVVTERATKDVAARLLVDGYAMVRRLSRLGSVEAVANSVVRHVAELLRAERVSLALHDQDDASLSIAATHGFPLHSVKAVRILPGEWVVGHVFASRRPLFVSDVRLLPAPSANSTKYRTFSFAAVPMLAGSEAVGVITVTDKRDRATFTRQDELVLRTLSAAAAVAIVAARAGHEVTRLAYTATIDSLTGLLNRPGLDSRLHQEVERSKRESGSLAILMADVDNFKTINDTYGHHVGDAVLREVGVVIRSSVRVFDVCARYGGDEFAVVMPNSDQESAVMCAERIRRRLADRAADDTMPALTMSIGVAVIAAGESAKDVLLRADQCLYRAKADGKNLVRAQLPPLRNDEFRLPEHPVNEPSIIEVGPLPERPIDQGDTARPAASALRYVLVVDSHAERAAFCLEAVAPFRVGYLMARDGAQAAAIIEQFGAPLLLVVDLTLPANDGFKLIEKLRSRHADSGEVIAWSASREMREYAGARLSACNVHVIASTAAPATIRGAIERLLDHQAVAPSIAEPAASWEPEELQRVMAALTDKVRHAVNIPGIAVYLRSPGDRRYRASFTWNSDELIPHSPHHIPAAFEEITRHGRPVILRDIADQPLGGEDTHDSVRGLAAFPVVSGKEILGAVCVFDVRPLEITARQLSLLESVGRLTDVEPQSQLVLGRSVTLAERVDEIDTRAIAVLPSRPVDWPPTLLERVGGEFAVARELARARRERKDLSVILFEIAALANDTDLDESVQHASETLIRTIRQSDLPIRWSGCEFLVVLPGLTGIRARSVAERVRAALQAGTRHQVAVAGGVAELTDEEGFSDVVNRAREKVSHARGRGHNRIF